MMRQTSSSYTMPKPATVIVGIGGCGSNMVNSFVASKQIDCHTIGVDTDSVALKSSKADERLLLDNRASSNCGLRGDIELGIQTGIHFREKFLQRIAGYGTITFCAGLGGGTGSGITAVFTKAAIDMERDVLCFLTMPFTFEGEERHTKAQAVLKEIGSYGAWLEIFDNQKLFDELPKGATFGDAYKIVNKHFLSLLQDEAANGFDRQSYNPSRCKVS